MIHEEEHPQADTTVQVAIPLPAMPKTLSLARSIGNDPVTDAFLFNFVVEDWEDRVAGEDTILWDRPVTNFAQLGYVQRLAAAMVAGLDVPHDGEIVYGKIGNLGFIIHTSEIVA